MPKNKALASSTDPISNSISKAHINPQKVLRKETLGMVSFKLGLSQG